MKGIISIIIIYLLVSNYSYSQSKKESVINDFYKKAGQKEIWKKIKTVRTESSIIIFDSISRKEIYLISYTKEPSIFYTHLIEKTYKKVDTVLLNLRESRLLHTTDKSWIIKKDSSYIQNMLVEVMTKKHKLFQVGNYLLGKRIYKLEEEEFKISVEDIENKNVLKFSKDNEFIYFYFNKKTKLIDKYKKGSNEILYTKYNKVSGIMSPFEIKKYEKGALISIQNIIQIEYNPKLPFNFFTLEYHTKKK